VRVAAGLLEKVKELERDSSVRGARAGHAQLRRDRNEKVDELVSELIIAVAIIVVLLALTLGTRRRSSSRSPCDDPA